MNTSEITKILSGHRLTKRSFNGVFSLDMIPKYVQKKPASYVINTDPSYQPGTHWIAIYFPVRGPAEFFDSFGRAPFNKRFIKFMKDNSYRYIYNRREMQNSLSLLCGNYCCLYILDRCRGRSMNYFVNRFAKKMSQHNDQIARILFKKSFKKKYTKHR